jgi:hypothetical protein
MSRTSFPPPQNPEADEIQIDDHDHDLRIVPADGPEMDTGRNRGVIANILNNRADVGLPWVHPPKVERGQA